MEAETVGISSTVMPPFNVMQPCVGSGVVGMDPLHFLAGCRTRRLNQALSVLS